MTNFEKYENEIKKYLDARIPKPGYECVTGFGFDKAAKKVCSCEIISCKSCAFYSPIRPCMVSFAIWGYSDYQEPLLNTESEDGNDKGTVK